MIKRLKDEREILSNYLNGVWGREKAAKKFCTLRRVEPELFYNLDIIDRLKEISECVRDANKEIKHLKEDLDDLFREHEGVRVLRPECVTNQNVISEFESVLTRTAGLETGQLYEDIMVVRAYYFSVIRDLILNGFTYNGEKYVRFTASAGQIRTKKTVFVKESVWDKYGRTLMCGLTVNHINKLGGININKFLAYLALCNSATDPWPDFDVRKSIVVDDMETLVHGVVDFVDHKSYKVSRREMDIPITHTDGCGMVLPRRCRKNTMVRLPWVKGLLTVFPFDTFVRKARRERQDPSIGRVVDIYGQEHDIIAEEIEVIFTKSQFKMHKYYKNWEQYIEFYEKFGCQSGKCNEEEDFLPDAKLNYQMLQTLTDVSDEELEYLASKTVDRISNIAADRDTMLSAFGAAESYRDKNDFQKCLQLYPELLTDPYTREMLKQIKQNLVKEGRSAKLGLKAKYMFLIPDMYAFCEWLFLGDKDPKGLLADGEVSCGLYYKSEKLDCLRSPHLYKEHAVRKNVVNGMTRFWFTPNAIYTSCHDLISKILQFDCDGDKSLVCSDERFIEIAERNMQGVVPLYYEMAKAGAVQITGESIYNGLRAAWTGGNIGVISNDITKIWNSADPDVDAVKILCMENNFVIELVTLCSDA